jgi:hypothetical protein
VLIVLVFLIGNKTEPPKLVYDAAHACMYENNLTTSNGTNHKQQKKTKRKCTSKDNAEITALTECSNPQICKKKKKST